jgi:uncharacterized RDD family membrane protein YckC
MIPGDTPRLPVRTAALLVDLVLIGLSGSLLEGLFAALRTILGGEWLVWVAYMAFFDGIRGGTPGKRLFGLRTVAIDGGAPEEGRAFVRAAVKVVPFLACQLAIQAPEGFVSGVPRVCLGASGVALVLVWGWAAHRDPMGLTPHDRASRTRVIRVA